MSKDLTVFENEEFGVIRTVVATNGSINFVAKDIVTSLEYNKSSIKQVGNVIAHVPNEWKGPKPIMTPGGVQQLQCLTEEGLNFFTFRSDKPKAIPFQKWLAGEVLPSIRKTGTYSVQASNKHEPCSFELEMIGAKHLSEMLDFSETSKLEITHAIYKNNGVPTKALPVYTSNVRANFSAKDLLDKNGCELSSVAFNKLMVSNSFMVNKERSSVGKKKKYFKSLVGKGLKYGKNDTSVHNPRETQPHYYEDTFMSLYDLVTK